MRKITFVFGVLFLIMISLYIYAAGKSSIKDSPLPEQIRLSDEKMSIAADNSPSDNLIILEAVWAAASGGGTWVTEVQITDMSGDPVAVQAGFYAGVGDNRTVTVWSSPGLHHSVKFDNILSTMQSLDPAFTYFGKSGTIWLSAYPSGTAKILASAKTYNGNYGKTLPGLQYIDANTANVGRPMVIRNLTNNSVYRTAIGCFNGTAAGFSLNAEFTLKDADNNTIGSPFSRSFNAYDFDAFNPFVEAGVGSGTYDNVWLYINPTFAGSSSLGLMCFGATTNNTTNDPSAHLAFQYQ
jgi:hypothetical protein